MVNRRVLSPKSLVALGERVVVFARREEWSTVVQSARGGLP